MVDKLKFDQDKFADVVRLIEKDKKASDAGTLNYNAIEDCAWYGRRIFDHIKRTAHLE